NPRPSGPVEQAPRLVQASLDPVEAARNVSGAIAYSAVLAREAATGDKAPAAAPAAAAAAAAPAPAAPRTTPPRGAEPQPVAIKTAALAADPATVAAGGA